MQACYLLYQIPTKIRCVTRREDGQCAEQTNLEAARSYIQHLQREVRNPVTQRLCSRQQIAVRSHNFHEVRPADMWPARYVN